MTHYLVTGGTGFRGAALVTRLTRDGHRVRVLDNNWRGPARRLEAVAQDVETVVADIRDAAEVRCAARGIDCAVHLAAVQGTETFYRQPELVLDVGVRGILNLIDACRAEAIGDLVVVSSSEAYQTPPAVPTDETVPLCIPDLLNPRYSYAGSKILTELVAVNYGRTGFRRVAVVRPHNVYGPDMGWQHVIPQLAVRAAELAAAQPTGRLRLPIQGDGRQRRAFVHIDDFTEGMVRVLEAGEHLGVYHVGTMEEVSIADLAGKVAAALGRSAEIVAGPAPPGATHRRCPDIARMRALGYAPRIPLDDGLPGVVRWYADNRHLRPAAA
ncbi:MAG: NAD-dependent epimerase/dehydratase family protein [Kiloniellales bacterium]